MGRLAVRALDVSDEDKKDKKIAWRGLKKHTFSQMVGANYGTSEVVWQSTPRRQSMTALCYRQRLLLGVHRCCYATLARRQLRY